MSHALSATEAIKRIHEGDLTITQLLEDHLRRVSSRDAMVHGWAFLDPEDLREDARLLDALPRAQRGPLHGLLLAVKDVIYTKRMPTGHGSPIYEGTVVELDAAVVAILKAQGALVMGKTHTAEFATLNVGPATRNPLDLDRTPGGSSSGSAAVVKDHQCPVSLGTQTIGSVIRPASFNDIFGVKFTYGAVSMDGIKTCAAPLDTLGVFARSVNDMRLIARALGIFDAIPPVVSKPRHNVRGMRFAFVKTSAWPSDTLDEQSSSLAAAWKFARESLEQAGAETSFFTLSTDFDLHSKPDNVEIMHQENKINLRVEYLQRPELLHPTLLQRIEASVSTPRLKFVTMLDRLARLRPIMDDIANKYDALVTPSALGIPPPGINETGDPRFNGLWTALHVPCMNVPCWRDSNGLPVGMTLVKARYCDESLLSVGELVADVWSR